MTPDLLIANCALLANPQDGTIIPSGYIAIKGAHISAIGPMTDCPPVDSWTVLDASGQLAMSGLVNGHCHAPMTLFRGLADDLSLSEWLQEYIFPAEARYVHPEMVYWCSKLAAAEMLLSGTTTVADGYFHEGEVARACAETGLRCVAAQGIIDFPAPGVSDPQKNIAHAENYLSQWQQANPLITPAVFAHAPYTCSAATLRDAKELARRYEVPFFIHVSETREEISLIPDPAGPTPVRHLEQLGLLDRDTVCVHGVWCDEEDLDILARTKAAVIVCPQSHLKLASGMAPLQTMLARGIRVGLGTDGAASNNSLDMFREMDLAAKVQKVAHLDPVAVPAGTMLDIATRGTADAIGLGGQTGRLAPGALADIVLLDLNAAHLQPFHSISHLVYAAGAADVRNVLVHGRIVVKDRALLTVDLKETMDQVRELAAKVVRNLSRRALGHQ